MLGHDAPPDLVGDEDDVDPGAGVGAGFDAGVGAGSGKSTDERLTRQTDGTVVPVVRGLTGPGQIPANDYAGYSDLTQGSQPQWRGNVYAEYNTGAHNVRWTIRG